MTFDLQRHKLHLPLFPAGGASGVGQKWLPTLEREGREREREKKRERERERGRRRGREGERDDKPII